MGSQLAKSGLVVGWMLLALGSAACQRGEAPSESKPEAAADSAEPAARPEPEPSPQQEAEAAELIRADGTLFAEAELMGTRTSINVWVGEGSPAKAQKAITDAMMEMARIESIASEWQPQSDLSRLNDAAGGALEVAPELVEILARAEAVSRDTEGLFDVSFHGVGALWSFRPGARPPSAEAIAERLPLVDWTQIELDAEASTAKLAKPGMKVGLGAIAKGYAVDAASELLRARGFVHHIVEAGGDTYVSGTKGGESWRVGVQDPKRATGRVGYLPVRDEAVVTSGNYARYFVWEGVHYTHILDPRTGWPIPSDESPKSVTLVAKDATTADAYCTAVSVMEPEAGLAFVDARPELEAVILGPDDRVHVSKGLAAVFVDERQEPSEGPGEGPRESLEGE